MGLIHKMRTFVMRYIDISIDLIHLTLFLKSVNFSISSAVMLRCAYRWRTQYHCPCYHLNQDCESSYSTPFLKQTLLSPTKYRNTQNKFKRVMNYSIVLRKCFDISLRVVYIMYTVSVTCTHYSQCSLGSTIIYFDM